ncbi:MAG: alpha/beta hydrolase [Firmicutes bacterium]|nr:alpha/beta hydrolase [Bacillota bacterium]
MLIFLWTIVGLGAGVAVLLLAAVTYQAIGRARDRRRFPPPGRLVPVGGHRLHLLEAGAGEPAVIFDAGLPGTSLGWCYVQPAVAEFTRTVSYDRAGLGWSERGPRPRTTRQIVTELRAALTNAGIAPPYVLVGHSFGGFTARLFAHSYPEDVAGIVLVDSIHPREWLEPDAETQRKVLLGIRLARRTAALARLGAMRFYFWLIARRAVQPTAPSEWVASLQKMPRELLPALRALWSEAKPYLTVADQIEALHASAAQVAEADAPRDLPLIVLSAGNADARRLRDAAAIAKRSSRGVHLLAHGSGHWIQLDQPELIIAAIRQIVEQYRQTGGLQAPYIQSKSEIVH